MVNIFRLYSEWRNQNEEIDILRVENEDKGKELEKLIDENKQLVKDKETIEAKRFALQHKYDNLYNAFGKEKQKNQLLACRLGGSNSSILQKQKKIKELKENSVELKNSLEGKIKKLEEEKKQLTEFVSKLKENTNKLPLSISEVQHYQRTGKRKGARIDEKN